MVGGGKISAPVFYLCVLVVDNQTENRHSENYEEIMNQLCRITILILHKIGL